jgi:hypothetical protein
LFKDFVSKLYRGVVYLLGCMEIDWGALALGVVGLSLEIFVLPPPPSPKIKSQAKSVIVGWFPQTFWERVWVISWGY